MTFTTITVLQLICLFGLSFAPVWLGGQAMTCYNEGNTFKSFWCVAVGTVTNFAIILSVTFASRLSL